MNTSANMLNLYQKTNKPSRQPGNIFPRVKEKSEFLDSLDDTMPNNIEERIFPLEGGSPQNFHTNEENLLE